MIIGITGTLAAGKGTIVEHLEKLGFKHYSVRKFLTKIIKELGLELNRDSMVRVANELREKYSPSYIVEELYSEAKKIGGDIVIESIRTVGEVKALKGKENFYLFSVDANQKLRYSRAIERASETDKINFETFIKNEKREMESDNPTKQNLKECIKLADFKFMNNSTIEELYKKIDSTIEALNTISKKTEKRNDYISWDEYFMGVAILSSKRSKDPSTQVGACIVDENKRIVGTGYNGAPRGFNDEDFPWKREGDFLSTKYAYVCHAELNAILNSTIKSLIGCTMYVVLFPCNECSKAIVQSGIKRIIYLSDKYKDTDSHIASRRILDMANIKYEKFNSDIEKINLNFK